MFWGAAQGNFRASEEKRALSMQSDTLANPASGEV